MTPAPPGMVCFICRKPAHVQFDGSAYCNYHALLAMGIPAVRKLEDSACGGTSRSF